MKEMRAEPGSFRDRQGRVFYIGNQVFRGLSPTALAEWEALSRTRFFNVAMSQGHVVATERVDPDRFASAPRDLQGWAGYLTHTPISFVSYPYEWSFSMLKDAALLHLNLLAQALQEEFILKDASSFNIQWRGAQPVFIDIPSFERWSPGEPWSGYRQFCQLFLYPLMLQAYKDISFRPWLRGRIDGVEPDTMANLFHGCARFKRGVLAHVVLQAKLQAKAGDTKRNVRSDLKRAGFNKTMIEANVKRLHRFVERLTWRASRSQWSHYTDLDHYAGQEKQAKADFVRRVAATKRWAMVWDIGANTGEFTRLVAEYADCVVAMDADELAIERLYGALREQRDSRILPLLVDLADASPALGWRGLERKSLTQRRLPQLTLCLALIHHIVIGANIPLTEFIGWLAGLNSALIIEFVDKQDPMVQQLLRNKDDVYDDYDEDVFRTALAGSFKIAETQTLGTSRRTLYFARPNHG